MVTAWRMNEWSSIKYFFGNKFYAACAKFMVTMIATVIFDLTVAIVIGIVLSAILFIFRSAKMTTEIAKVENSKFSGSDDIESIHKNSYIIYVTGPIFFLNAQKFEHAFKSLSEDCHEVLVSFRGVSAVDTTGVETIGEICEFLKAKNIRVIVSGLNDNVFAMLNKGKITDKIGKENIYKSVDKALLA